MMTLSEPDLNMINFDLTLKTFFNCIKCSYSLSLLSVLFSLNFGSNLCSMFYFQSVLSVLFYSFAVRLSLCFVLEHSRCRPSVLFINQWNQRQGMFYFSFTFSIQIHSFSSSFLHFFKNIILKPNDKQSLF